MNQKLNRLAATLALAVSCASSTVAQNSASGSATVRYLVRVEPGRNPRAAVRLELGNLPAHLTKLALELPQGFAFTRLPAPLMDGELRAAAGDKPLSVTHDSPYEWTIAVSGERTVVVEYAVPLTHRALPAVKERDAYEYPYLADDHGMLVTATLIARPRDLAFAAAQVKLAVPDGWDIIAPWKRVDTASPDARDPAATAAGSREKSAPRTWPKPAPDAAAKSGLHNRTTFEIDDPASLANDLIAVGAWRKHEIEVGQYRCTIALAPGQPTLENAVADPIRRIVEHELALFGRRPEGRYLFLFGRPDTPGMAGSPKTRSMTLSVAPELAAFAGKHLAHLVAHEFHHTWGGEPTAIGDDLRFLNEGFTDYYAYLVSARLGLISWDDFADELEKKMRTAADSPLRGKMSLADAGGTAFFSDRAAYDLTYAGGTLVAAWLDRALRSQPAVGPPAPAEDSPACADPSAPGPTSVPAATKSLDELMRRFRNDPKWRQPAAEPHLPDLLAAVEAYAGRDIASQLRRIVSEPYAFDPAAELTRLGAPVTRTKAPCKPELRANLDGTRIRDLDPDCLAAKIGLRAGDELIEINGTKVANAKEAMAAFSKPAADRIQAVYRRDGAESRIDALIPAIEIFDVSPRIWRSHEP